MSELVGAAPAFPEQIELIEARFPGRAIRDTAVTHALLRQVAAGQRAATLRLYRPDDVVVFSLLDARRPGFPAALEAARDAGCGAVLRLGGGHAALFHQRSLAFSLAVPDGQARDGIRRRFEAVSGLIARALGRLGVDARVGEVAGEYCPGEHSVNARGARKLMGVGQRVIRGGAHVGGVIVVQDAERVREVLRPVYCALDLEWQTDTAGSVADEVTGIGIEAVRDAILHELGRSHRVAAGALDDEALALAEELDSWHRPGAAPRPHHRANTATPGSPAAKTIHAD